MGGASALLTCLISAPSSVAEGAVVSNKEHLLTAVYELKSLGDQPVSTSPWKTPPVFSSLNSQSSDSVRNSPVKLVGFTEDRTPDIASTNRHKIARLSECVEYVVIVL